MSFLQPKYKVVGKMEEAIPARLKELGYPFNITKSAMFSVGSPLTWPALLAALSWLRELVEVCGAFWDVWCILGCGVHSGSTLASLERELLLWSSSGKL